MSHSEWWTSLLTVSRWRPHSVPFLPSLINDSTHAPPVAQIEFALAVDYTVFAVVVAGDVSGLTIDMLHNEILAAGPGVSRALPASSASSS